MTLTFTHLGQSHTLAKHPAVRAALRAGTMTEAEARIRPWYLRKTIEGEPRQFNLKTATDREAIRAAKDILNGHVEQPATFSAFVQAQETRRGLTLGAIAEQWLAAGLPHNRTRPRTTAAADRLRGPLARALKWWSQARVTAVDRRMIEEFVVWRRTNNRRAADDNPHAGSRSADLELSALSSLCEWATATQTIDANPFADRDTFTDAASVTRTHAVAPESDDQLHKVLSWFWRDDASEKERIAGGYLCVEALTGLRPGEAQFLRRVPALTHFPYRLMECAPGTIYPCPDGTRRMRVHRLKGGQNPAVLVHPVLEQFLTIWTAHLDTIPVPLPVTCHPSPVTFPPLFPLRIEDSYLNHALNRACAALNLPHLTPKGVGRGFYVKVRRAQGTDDATIAMELGQTTNGKLIRDTYGDPTDQVGGNLHDWLPTGAPAWTLLQPETQSNVVNL